MHGEVARSWGALSFDPDSADSGSGMECILSMCPDRCLSAQQRLDRKRSNQRAEYVCKVLLIASGIWGTLCVVFYLSMAQDAGIGKNEALAVALSLSFFAGLILFCKGAEAEKSATNKYCTVASATEAEVPDSVTEM